MKRELVLAPSVLSADFSDIRSALYEIKTSKAQWVHLDVMDGVFVPNITFGPKFIEDIRPYSDLFFDTHLMICEPWKYVENFAKAGSDAITVHYEACSDNLLETLKLIKSFGCKAGVSVKPDTKVEVLSEYLEYLDLILIMSVNPGFGGQKFMPETMEKVKKLANLKEKYNFLVSVDGGLNTETVSCAIDAGVDVIVAGSAFFKSSDKSLFVKEMIGN